MRIHPTLRILAIVTLVLGFGLTGAWIYLRQSGLQAGISPVRHAFFDSHPNEAVFLIADPAVKQDPVSLDQLKAAAAVDLKIIIWLDLQMTADEKIVVMKQKDIILKDGSAQLVGLTKSTDLSALLDGKKVLLAADVMKAIPDHRLLLNIRDYRPGLDGKLAQLVDEQKAVDRVLIQSEQDGILRDVRHLRPTFLFGTSQAQVTQLLMLLNFGLGANAPLKGDVYVSAFSRGHSHFINQDVVDEIHRRSRKVFAGPVDDLEGAQKLRAFGVDGVITGNPESLVSLIR